MQKWLEPFLLTEVVIRKLHLSILRLILLQYLHQPAIGLKSRMFANGPGDRGSIPGRVIPKTQKNGTWCRLT